MTTPAGFEGPLADVVRAVIREELTVLANASNAELFTSEELADKLLNLLARLEGFEPPTLRSEGGILDDGSVSMRRKDGRVIARRECAFNEKLRVFPGAKVRFHGGGKQ